ncbi:hypothetical protein Taro_010032 [Colocasia esculenta]|uniref:Pentatricopeptide repeat-containing protein n=1 Tax=Colocasia esculenta TaxID=4460 RepID=A0A843U8C7_COLES|nr:hypothetical protein [Colocasia esculenta]
MQTGSLRQPIESLLPTPPPPGTTSDCIHALLLGSRSLIHAKQAHAQAAARGLLHRSLPICAALILAYSDFGDSPSSRRLFEESPLRRGTAFLWNTLVRAFTKAGLHVEAFGVYNQMARAGVRPDDRTFPFVLTACADAVDLRKGKEVHGAVVKSGFGGDVFVGNTLVSFYGACSVLSHARKVFDDMSERDVVSWNSLISLLSDNGCFFEALNSFRELTRSELAVNSVSVLSVLPACSALENEARGIHAQVIKLGLVTQITVGNALMDMYGKCGDLAASFQAFDLMAEKNDVSWNTMIGNLAHDGLCRDALGLFRDMLADGTKLNSITISSLLPALVELGLFQMAQEIHGYSIRCGWDSDIFVANSLVDMYAKWSRTEQASDVFNGIKWKNVVSWNAMIANFAQNHCELKAIDLIREMGANNESPNSVTYANVLPACARVAAVKHGKEIHARSIRVEMCSDIFVSNALIDMYAKSGCLDLARKVFEISEKDEVSYNALIVGYSRSLQCSEALSLFVEMQHVGLKYDAVSFMGVLSACANLSSIKRGKEVHALSIRKHFHDHLFVSNSLLDVYTKRGHMDAAERIFCQIQHRDVASWNSMILGYGMQGKHRMAIDLFDRMKDGNVEYDSVSYIAVLSACSHCRLVERGKMYFNQLLSQNVKQTQMHYACMVDLLGRAGFMEEAVEFIKGMPFEPGSDVWGALLGACRVHGNLELGRLAAEHLFRLKPGHSGYYILLSNMYAEAGRWKEALDIRELMKRKGVKKNPGCSWVDTGDRAHAFLVGETLEEIRADMYSLDFG